MLCVLIRIALFITKYPLYLFHCTKLQQYWPYNQWFTSPSDNFSPKVKTEKVCDDETQFEPPHDKTNKMTCAPSEDSDQPGHPPSLIRVFAVRMKNHWALNYLLSAQWRLWSDWADAQADLSLCWVHVILSVLLCGGSFILLHTFFFSPILIKQIYKVFTYQSSFWSFL